MPFTNSPIVDTYSAKEIQVSTDILLRPSSIAQGNALITQDAGMVNLLPIKEGSDEVAITRPCIVNYNPAHMPPTGNLRGFYVWDTGPSAGSDMHTFVVVDNILYYDNGSGGWLARFTFTNSFDNPVRFAEFIDGTNTKKLICVDGTQGVVIDTSNTATEITDTDFPTPHVPFPVFMDGYIFLAKANTGDIYNCDLNNPASWTAGNFISAEMFPDNVNALVRVGSHIVAIGKNSTEYFYDAGNSPGTPLARVEAAALPIGTTAPNSIATNKGSIVLLANNNDGQASVTVIENQRFTDIGGNFAVPLLSAKASQGWVSDSSVRGYFFRYRSELYYVLSFGRGDAGDVSGQAPTFVYSFAQKKWTEFRYGATGTAAFPVYFTQGGTIQGRDTWCAGRIGTTTFVGNFKDATGLASDQILAEGTTPIYQEFRTASTDFGTLNRKWIYRLALTAEAGDSTLRDGTDPVSFSVSWTDDDYKTWSTPTTVNLATQDSSGNSTYYPYITQLGSCVRRAFRVTYTGKPMTYRKLTLDINKGQQ